LKARWLPFAILAALLSTGAAQVQTAGDSRIGWQRLVFRSGNLLTRFSAALEVTRGPDSLLAELRTELSPILLTPRRSLVQTWFDDADGGVLRRVTRTWAPRPDEKVYRFTQEGVSRTRLEPLRGEAGLPTSRWSQVRESFIPFHARDLGCEVVSDAAALLYRASQLEAPGDAARLRACVFDGKTLYRLEIEPGETRTLPVGYEVLAAGGERRSPSTSRARHFTVRALPIAGEMEPYPTPVEIFLDEESGLPVRASLAVGDFGTIVDVDLAEIVESGTAPPAAREAFDPPALPH
jgi:hypothetical protein